MAKTVSQTYDTTSSPPGHVETIVIREKVGDWLTGVISDVALVAEPGVINELRLRKSAKLPTNTVVDEVIAALDAGATVRFVGRHAARVHRQITMRLDIRAAQARAREAAERAKEIVAESNSWARAQEIVDHAVAAGKLVRLVGGRLIERENFDPAIHGLEVTR